MGSWSRPVLAWMAVSLPLAAYGGPLTGPSGGVGVSFNCESTNDSSFTPGTTRATDTIAFVFPAGGGNLARTQLGYTAAISSTLLNLDTRIALPEATAAANCLVGGSLSLAQPISFTGTFTSTVDVLFQAILDEWIIDVPSAAPVGTDASFSFSFGLGADTVTEDFTVTPGLGPVPSDNPAAWTITPLGGGRFSVSGSLSVTATLATASPSVVDLLADSFSFVPGGTTGISVTNDVAQALHFEVVSLTPGVTAFTLGVPPPAPQASPQQKCLGALNTAGAKVARAQTKLDEKCLKDATKGKEPSALGCAIADAKGKVEKASIAVMNADADKCQKSPEQLPSFSYVFPTAIYIPASDEGIGLFQDLLGNPDLAIRTDKAEVSCQSTVLSLMDKVLDAFLKEAVAAKKQALKDGVESSAELQEAIETALVAPEKLVKAETKLQQGADKKCTGIANLALVFPGAVAVGVTPADVADYATARARCRGCRLLNSFDALTIDCDVFDEGATNASCP